MQNKIISGNHGKKQKIARQSFFLYDFVVSDFIKPKPKDCTLPQVNYPYKKEENDDDEVPPISTFEIQMFGMNTRGQTCSIRVTNFNPFFYVQIPDNWGKINISIFVNYLKNKIGKQWQSSILSANLVKRNNLYKFEHGLPDTFMELIFANETAFCKTRALWTSYVNDQKIITPLDYKGHKLCIFESGIPPLLRYFHIHNISPSGWVQINAPSIAPQYTQTWCDFEYICTCDKLQHIVKYENVPLITMSMDIEANNTHGAFPQPIKNYQQAAVQIVDEYNLRNKQLKTVEQTQQYLVDAVLSLFQYNRTFTNIQCVYPKTSISEANVRATMTRIFAEGVTNQRMVTRDIIRVLKDLNIVSPDLGHFHCIPIK